MTSDHETETVVAGHVDFGTNACHFHRVFRFEEDVPFDGTTLQKYSSYKANGFVVL